LGVHFAITLLVRRRLDRPSWTVTSLYAAGAIGASVLLPRIESRLLPTLVSPVSVAAATAIYSSIAAGMIALTGIVFSLSFVMVQFSAAAYSPRLMLRFSRDPLLAHAFGTFTATFLSAIAALGWIDPAGAPGRVPLISTVMVFALLLASVAMFVGLINRVATLQINRALAFAGDQGRTAIDVIYPHWASAPPDIAPRRPAMAAATQVVAHRGSASRRRRSAIDAIVEVAVAIGDTVEESMPVVRVFGARIPIDERDLAKCIALGMERTFDQDPKYAIRLLVDTAIRALSPAINDPTTAVQALDQIGDLLVRLGRRRLEIGSVYDDRGAIFSGSPSGRFPAAAPGACRSCAACMR